MHVASMLMLGGAAGRLCYWIRYWLGGGATIQNCCLGIVTALYNLF